MGTIRELQSNITVRKINRSKIGSDLIWGNTGYGCGSDSSTSGWHIKVEVPIYMSALHVTVKRNNVGLIYNSDWVFSRSYPSGISDITDGVRLNINSYAAGDTYDIEYTELQSSYVPIISGYRIDGLDVTNKEITPRLWRHNTGFPLCDDKYLVLWKVNRVGEFAYDAIYASPNPAAPPHACEMTVNKTYSTHFRVRDFEDNKTLPDDWRIELYNVGKQHSRGTGQSGNINLTPKFESKTNRLQFYEGHNKYNLYMRLRHTSKNIVTQFSNRKIYIRRKYAWQYGNFGDSPIGKYYKSGII